MSRATLCFSMYSPMSMRICVEKQQQQQQQQ
jgi:hypothetical protein